MRIIVGSLGGRQFASPRGHRTRPMSDKVRGALFNTLGDLAGLTVLDAFAGSGALAYEALSRGATSVIAIDSDTSAQKTIAENTKLLGHAKQLKLIKANASSWLITTDEAYDIILLDPPYQDLQPNLLTRLADRAKPGGLVVASLPPKADFKLPESYELLAQKHYGDASLTFYRRTN